MIVSYIQCLKLNIISLSYLSLLSFLSETVLFYGYIIAQRIIWQKTQMIDAGYVVKKSFCLLHVDIVGKTFVFLIDCRNSMHARD